jgi:hypothetical protein
MTRPIIKNWVVVRSNGSIKIWRDYDNTWGAPGCEVIGYAPTYRQAQGIARDERRGER